MNLSWNRSWAIVSVVMIVPSELVDVVLDVDEPSPSGFEEWSPPSRAATSQVDDAIMLNEEPDITGIACGV